MQMSWCKDKLLRALGEAAYPEANWHQVLLAGHSIYCGLCGEQGQVHILSPRPPAEIHLWDKSLKFI